MQIHGETYYVAAKAPKTSESSPNLCKTGRFDRSGAKLRPRRGGFNFSSLSVDFPAYFALIQFNSTSFSTSCRASRALPNPWRQGDSNP